MTVKVTPVTKVAQTLQPRFVAGDPPDVIDNSGAGRSGSIPSGISWPS